MRSGAAVDLARLIGGGEGPKIRKAVITAAAADGTVTIRLGGSSVDIAGVSILAGAFWYVGAAVMVCQNGPDLFVLGASGPRPRCEAQRNSNQSIANATFTEVSFGAEAYDIGAMHSNSVNADRITAPVDGIYQVDGYVRWQSNATGIREIGIYKGGNPHRVLKGPAGTGNDFLTVAGQVALLAGEYVTVTVRQTSGGSLLVESNSGAPRFAAAWVAPYPY